MVVFVVPKGPIDAIGKMVLISVIFWKILLKNACGACVCGCRPRDLQIWMFGLVKLIGFP